MLRGKCHIHTVRLVPSRTTSILNVYIKNMITRQEIEKITWIDLINPTKEDVLAIMDEFDIHPVVAEELLVPTLHSRVDEYPKYLYLILHFPALRHTQKSHQDLADNQEIDIIIGKKFLITTRYSNLDPILNLAKTLEINSILQKNTFGEHAGFLFYHLMKRLYTSLEIETQFIADALIHVENRMFDGKERDLVFELSVISSSLVGFRTSIRPHREVLNSLEIVGKDFFDKDFGHYLKAITDQHYKVFNIVQSNFDTLGELRETNNSLLSTKQSETMKTLTIMAFVTFPLSLIASIFGMNTTHTPIAEGPFGFWYIMLLMLIASGIFFTYFKYKKWL